MPTRIKGSDGSPIEGAGRNRSVAKAQPAGRSSAAASTSSAGGAVESVHITSAAHQMLALSQQIGETPDVDVAKVEKLRADINQNRYQVDAGKIADRLLQLEGDLQATSANPSSVTGQ